MGIKVDLKPGTTRAIYGRIDNNTVTLVDDGSLILQDFKDIDDVAIHHEPITNDKCVVIQQEAKIDYNVLLNQPRINGHVLQGNLTLQELGLENREDYIVLNNKPSINNIELNGNLSSNDLGIRDIVNYNEMDNLPSINNVKLVGNLTTEDLGIKTEVEDTQTYIELNLNFNPNTASVSIMNWITSNAYEVADEVNQQGKPVIAKGYLYYDGNFLETVYLNQTLYSDSAAWGRFKYFLGFTDDETFAYLRINKSGTAICGVKKFI